MKLSELKNTHRFKKRCKRVGRGPGSKRGKTCCRGHKGDKSRSGYKRRAGKEGGQLPLFQKLPHRGFSNARFAIKKYAIGLDRLSQCFEDGEVVTRESLMSKGFPLRRVKEVRIIATGEMTKKLVIQVNNFTKNAVKKLEEKGIEFKRV